MQDVAEFEIGAAECVFLFAGAQLLACHHDWDRRLGDKVVAERPKKNTFKGRSTTGTEDNESRIEAVNLRTN